MKKIEKPEIRSVGLVAENILLLTIQQGAVEGGVQEPYVAQPGETLEADVNIPALVYIKKDGKAIGVKVEDTQLGIQRWPYEWIVGEKLDEEKADSSESYRVNGKRPLRVYRKTKPNGFADPYIGYTYCHKLYLVCEEPFTEGKKIEIAITPGIYDRDSISFALDSKEILCEALQTNQLGYRKDDPSKIAYLSQWMGLGGGISYESYKTFFLINAQGEKVYEGTIRLNHNGDLVPMSEGELTSECHVYELYYSDFSQEGTFHILVPGLGCSLPIVIGEKSTWEAGFRANMNAIYCQRSGIVTGPPYTDFKRPRVYHPEDGRVVYQSNCSLFESGNGLNAYGTDFNNFGNLVRKQTDEIVEDAWGGYFDACDWDRRIQHLKATRLQVELYLMWPEYFDKLSLPIPESGNGIPDILNEGRYNLDFYKRLQLPNGGIRGGIEAEEHPVWGQGGWQDSWKAFAYAPDFWSSWYYAGAAAQMAYALREKAPELSFDYRKSAEAAFAYAEATYFPALEAEGHKWTRSARARAILERERAAVELFRLTLEEQYNKIYLEIRKDSSYDSDFVYALLPNGIGCESVKRACRTAILAAADRALTHAGQLPYHLPSEDPASEYAGPWAHICTVTKNTELIRAHYLTGEEKYLKAALAAADFGVGANPDNMCFTTGVGIHWPKHVLHHDARLTGQEVPAGITIFGPHDFNHPDDAIVKLLRADFMWPGAYVWPSFESYLDIYRHPCMNEYTVQGTLGPNSYQWGYFAARAAL